MAPIKLIAVVILTTIVVILGAQNTQSVTFHFLVFALGPAPVVFAVFLAAVIGLAVGWLVSLPGQLHGRSTRRGLEQQIRTEQDRTSAAIAETEDVRTRSRPPSLRARTPKG